MTTVTSTSLMEHILMYVKFKTLGPSRYFSAPFKETLFLYQETIKEVTPDLPTPVCKHRTPSCSPQRTPFIFGGSSGVRQSEKPSALGPSAASTTPCFQGIWGWDSSAVREVWIHRTFLPNRFCWDSHVITGTRAFNTWFGAAGRLSPCGYLRVYSQHCSVPTQNQPPLSPS